MGSMIAYKSLNKNSSESISGSSMVKKSLNKVENLLDVLGQQKNKIYKLNREKFNLYYHAPIGYFTLGRNSIIKDVNFKGCDILGVEGIMRDSDKLSSFIAADSEIIYNNFLANARRKKDSISANITLKTGDGSEKDVKIISMPELKKEKGNLTISLIEL